MILGVSHSEQTYQAADLGYAKKKEIENNKMLLLDFTIVIPQ